MEIKGVPAQKVKESMDSFYATWNTSIMKDTAVTMGKYLEHCKERNADPTKEYRFLDVNKL
jgi:hypothetical protein